MNLEELKLLPKWDMVLAVNTLLQELNSRECYLIDWENPDMYLDHIEYHSADSIWNGKSVKGFGDRTDNIYTFYKMLKEPRYGRTDTGSAEAD